MAPRIGASHGLTRCAEPAAALAQNVSGVWSLACCIGSQNPEGGWTSRHCTCHTWRFAASGKQNAQLLGSSPVCIFTTGTPSKHYTTITNHIHCTTKYIQCFQLFARNMKLHCKHLKRICYTQVMDVQGVRRHTLALETHLHTRDMSACFVNTLALPAV